MEFKSIGECYLAVPDCLIAIRQWGAVKFVTVLEGAHEVVNVVG